MSLPRLIFTIAILAIVGPLMIINGLEERRLKRELWAKGVQARGAVVEKEMKSARRSGWNYYVTVRYFHTEGRPEAVRRFLISRSEYRRLEPGAEVLVRFLPRDPEVAELVGSSDDSLWSVGLGVVILITAGVLSLRLRKAELD